MLRKTSLALLAGAALIAAALVPARAEIPGNKIRLGVLTDLSGFASDSTGIGSVAAAKLAAEDFKKEQPGLEVEVISLDHQNKPDIGSATARKWIADSTVDAILDVPFSSVALAVQEAVRGSKVAFIASGPGTALLTGEKCSPNTVHWTYDTWALAHGTALALLKQKKDTWFFITADYAFGHALEADAMAVVKAENGKILGAVRHPTNAADFSSFILQAQGSGAQVVALANAVGDTINSVKAASEFGLTAKQSLAALLMQLTDVHSLGLPVAKGLYLTEGFYWNTDDGTRAFADRFAAQTNGRRPTANQAGVYAGTLHYLRAAAAAKSTDGQVVVAKMKEMPSNDPLFGKGEVRADGRHIHNMYLFQVKTPDQSKGPWDYYNLVETIPAKEAFRPMAEGKCPMVAKN
ncbi:ABC transporter substrate-binding protein [Xanthobacter dioxanivorans]|uniref:ABC transporter substrate-binding protein n=1 Tax=Xanthobacter dioxanivorans TaxID=2528964 RepID=A0A974SIH3_9HYPH|nr:ABC transporter substrate-binding protein [Xanthobacter dioxanivorans]QRG06427.1 ABC transporter substrate-binding protein [Xanthobacter dioxanivorans]